MSPSPVAAALDHFHCYEAQSDPSFTKQQVTLVDQFSTGTSSDTVRRPRRVCNPTDKNGEDPTAATHPDHLVGYPIVEHPRFHAVRNVAVVNQFHGAGTPLMVDLVRPEIMLVPSLKSLTAPPAPGPTFTDHFKCYRVKGARFRRAGITLQDEFGAATVDVKRPRHLCAPADKNGEGAPLNPASFLMCYELRLASSDRPFSAAGDVFVQNQFGEDQFGAFRVRELCVPSQATPQF